VVVAGRTASYTVSLSAVGGFLGAVELSVAGLPPGARATFLPSPVFPGVPSTLAVETYRSARPGEYTLTITGKSGSLVRTGIAGLTVKASGPSARRIAHYQARARARQQARLLALRARRK
jgi:uncharacterized membrane protein